MNKNKIIKPTLTKDKNGNGYSFTLSSDNIDTLVTRKQLSPKLAKQFFNQIAEANDLSIKYKEFHRINPRPTESEINNFLKTLRIETCKEIVHKCELMKQFGEIVIHNWEKYLSIFNENNTQETSLFSAVNLKEDFGIPRQITDPVNRLRELMQASALKKNSDGFVVEGKISNSYGNAIVLQYELNTSLEKEAEKLFNQYKNTMLSKGLKIWMGYWRMANEQYSLVFSCPMIDIMKAIASEERTAPFFSVKEKKDHWAITKMLKKTRISWEKSIKKRGQNITKWIEQPLLEILGGEKEANETYPEIIAVSVLRPQPDTKYFPAIYKNSTLQLHPTDLHLAYYIQTRAAQLGKGERSIKLDWWHIFSLGGLEKTSHISQTQAKKQIREKMDRLKSKTIIEEWKEFSFGIIVSPKTQQKK